MPENPHVVPITLEQQKLLANALRIKILHLTAETPRTTKQIADVLGETPGNIYYHVQKLYQADLLDLVDSREVGGIVEKFYRAKSTRFRLSPSTETLSLFSRLSLTSSESEQLLRELETVLHRWEQTTAHTSGVGKDEFEIRIHLTPSTEERHT